MNEFFGVVMSNGKFDWRKFAGLMLLTWAYESIRTQGKDKTGIMQVSNGIDNAAKTITGFIPAKKSA